MILNKALELPPNLVSTSIKAWHQKHILTTREEPKYIDNPIITTT